MQCTGICTWRMKTKVRMFIFKEKYNRDVDVREHINDR